MQVTDDAEVQSQVESLQSLFHELNIPVDEDLSLIVASHSCSSSRRTSEVPSEAPRCCPVHGCVSPPSPPPPPLPPRPDRSNHTTPSELHSSHGQYTQVGAMPSTTLYDRAQAAPGPVPPPRSPRAPHDTPTSPHHFPNHLKRRGSLTRLNGAAGDGSPHHQQRRGSDHSTSGAPGSSVGSGNGSGAGSSSSGGTLGRNKGASTSSGGLLHADSYELSEELKEHEVEMLERKYSGRAGLMTPHRAARVIQRNFREYVFKKQFQMLRTERRPNRRLEHLQRSTSMLVDGDHPTPGSMPPGPPARAISHVGVPRDGGILSRALKQANSFEDVLLERAYSTCWTAAEPSGTGDGSGAGSRPPTGISSATPTASCSSGASSGGGSRDSGVDADQHQHVARREHVPPSHSASTTSMNSAATEASSGSAASSGSSSSGISSTTAATVVVKGSGGPSGVPGHNHHHQWRQGAPNSAVWQQQQQAQAHAGLVDCTASGQALLHHHHHQLTHQHSAPTVQGQPGVSSQPGQPGHQCSCHHHHHNHHQHPAHHRANATPQPTTPTTTGGHRSYTVPSSSPSPASSHSSVLSRDKYHRSGVDTPPSGPHSHSVSSERKRKRMYRVGLHIFNKKPERGLQFMMEKNFVGNTPQDAAQFLFTRKGLSRRMVGEYLGLLNNRFAQQVLDHYVELMDFRGMQVDEALRVFLSHFQMMGESQKVGKIIEVFSYYYAKANPEWMCQNLCRWETLYVLTYGIVMLHTDLHNPSVKSRRMKLEDFIANMRGLDDGRNLDSVLLQGIFQRTKQSKFELMADHTDMVRNIAENLRSSSKAAGESSANASNKEANPGQHLVANLVRAHRRLVCYCRLYEVTDMSKKEKPGAHLREVFLFNDMLLITKPVVKRISKEKINHYRKHFSLHNVQVYLFESQYYPYGVQIKSSLDGSVLATFHHANESDRSGFVDDLHESVLELSYVESMRIEGDIQQSHRRATAAAICTGATSPMGANAGSPRPPPPPVPQMANASPRSLHKDPIDPTEHDLNTLQAAHEQHLQASGGSRHTPASLTPMHTGSSTGSGNRYSADSGVAEQEFGSGSRTFYV